MVVFAFRKVCAVPSNSVYHISTSQNSFLYLRNFKLKKKLKYSQPVVPYFECFHNLLSDYENQFYFPSICNPHNDRRTTEWNFMKMYVAEFYEKLSSHLNFGVVINCHSVKLQSSLSLHKL